MNDLDFNPLMLTDAMEPSVIKTGAHNLVFWTSTKKYWKLQFYGRSVISWTKSLHIWHFSSTGFIFLLSDIIETGRSNSNVSDPECKPLLDIWYSPSNYCRTVKEVHLFLCDVATTTKKVFSIAYVCVFNVSLSLNLL